ncbi:unnamed protein product, partial [Musa textilis]
GVSSFRVACRSDEHLEDGLFGVEKQGTCIHSTYSCSQMKSCACLHVPVFSTMHNQSYNYENELVCRIGKLEVTVGRFTVATMISCSNPSLCR